MVFKVPACQAHSHSFYGHSTMGARARRRLPPGDWAVSKAPEVACKQDAARCRQCPGLTPVG